MLLAAGIDIARPVRRSRLLLSSAAAVGEVALHARLANLLRRHDVNDYAASVRVYALKPR